MTIMTQSLDEAGSKIFIKPNANSIAGWRPKQVSYSFLSIFLLDTNSFVLYCRTMWHSAPSRRSILLLVHLLIDAAAVSNFELLRPRSKSSWKHRVSILPRVMYKTRFQSFCPLSRPPRLSKCKRGFNLLLPSNIGGQAHAHCMHTMHTMHTFQNLTDHRK
jgi:hypothetical protein